MISSSPPPKGRSIRTLNAADIAAPLPKVPFLVPSLGIADGAPTIVAGSGFGGKTLAAQDAVLAVASGQDLWGAFPVRRGRTLHLDYEQGLRITTERYQRLARARDIELADLGDALRLAVMPGVYLDDADALDTYRRLFDGVDFAVVDSLRACAPSVSENDSSARRTLDMITRAAEQSRTVVLVIHHARKPRAGEKAGSRTSIRGSGAIFDGAASVFVFAGDKGQAIRVSHEKCRNTGALVPDFGLRIEDVPIGRDPRAGLRIARVDLDELGEGASGRSATTVTVRRRILGFLRGQNSAFHGSRSDLADSVGCQRRAALGELRALERAGMVTVEGARGCKRVVLTSLGDVAVDRERA